MNGTYGKVRAWVDDTTTALRERNQARADLSRLCGDMLELHRVRSAAAELRYLAAVLEAYGRHCPDGPRPGEVVPGLVERGLAAARDDADVLRKAVIEALRPESLDPSYVLTVALERTAPLEADR